MTFASLSEPAAPTLQIPISPPPISGPLLPEAKSTAEPPGATAGRNPDELEKFLINFVVEQTGYPPEVVELDDVMESLLCSGSIKRSQLFGELAEYFDVQPNENMTLDDFP